MEHNDVATLYLRPRSVIRLPIILTARWAENGLAIQRDGPGEKNTLGSTLHAGSEASYLKILARLTGSQAQPVAPKNASFLEELEKTGIDDSEGCQCSAEKKTHVADATIAFSHNTTNLLAALNDYLAGIEVNRDLTDIHGAVDQNTRQSVTAFAEIFQAVGQDLETSLNAAVEKCSHRQLAESDALTREAKLWRDSCLSVTDGLHRYRKGPGAFPVSPR
ncbi:hypothetical protein ACFPL7_00890 [Dongia soli]|uniref:Uncharacterized protein n=1 Tax=Dongia soli TaxID=600628 RepID=A0ABU5EDP9_9PROT|nr:hypothetical protein [Dongia soli]MDY0884336.1 hypothetical protein [Dongia soli]